MNIFKSIMKGLNEAIEYEKEIKTCNNNCYSVCFHCKHFDRFYSKEDGVFTPVGWGWCSDKVIVKDMGSKCNKFKCINYKVDRKEI